MATFGLTEILIIVVVIVFILSFLITFVILALTDSKSDGKEKPDKQITGKEIKTLKAGPIDEIYDIIHKEGFDDTVMIIELNQLNQLNNEFINTISNSIDKSAISFALKNLRAGIENFCMEHATTNARFSQVVYTTFSKWLEAFMDYI